jgi:hypothetical protein
MRLNRGTLLLATLLAIPVGAAGQSTTTGVLEGTVRSVVGVTLPEVQITLRRLRSGLPRVLETGPDGRFSAPLLQPGEYEILAEQLGFQPVIVGPIPVRVGRRSDVQIRLERVDGVVEAPDRVPYGSALVGGSRPGRITVIPAWERSALPFRDGDLSELVRTASGAEPGLAIQGLPTAFAALSVDGIGVPLTLTDLAAGHGQGLPPTLFQVTSVSESELVSSPQDVEWPSTASGLLAVATRSGPRGLEGGVDGYFTSDVLGLEDGPQRTSWRAGFDVGGSVAGDSAHVWLGVRAQQREHPVDYLPGGIGSAVNDLSGNGVGMDALQRRTATSERISAAGSFDWDFADGRSVRVSAQYAEGSEGTLLGSGAGLPVPASVDGSDLLVTTSAAANLAEALQLEIRLGFGISDRTQRAALPSTNYGDAAVTLAPLDIQLGGDARLPTDLRRSGIDGQATLHFRGEAHHVKVGAGLSSDWHEQTLGYDQGGRYLFGSPSAYAAGTGVLYRTDGGAPTADFSAQEYFLFAQDTWRLAPGLDLTSGLRYDLNVLPTDNLLRNRRWLQLTGIDNTDVDRVRGGMGFGVGFEWDVREAHEWLVRANGTVHRGEFLPETFTEGLTHDGRIEAYGLVGDVDDESALQSLGPRLTILNPSLDPPVTTRASFGITRALGLGTALHFGAVLRQTENLPRRRDLNLRTEPGLSDQYGRPVYGPLQQLGRVLQPEPGQNRRFGEFDAVSAISTDASSTYWGVMAAVERQAGQWLRLTGRYTYSGTRDDWVDPVPGQPFLPLSPFQDDQEVGVWRDGTSYFDVPHRAAAAFELQMPFAPMVRFGAVGRLSSGHVFTPGLGPGVDANGDGVSGNDPAFVDADLPGMDAVLGDWTCLRSSVGRFAERNSCRLPMETAVDAWLGVRWPAVRGVSGELRVEGLGLVNDGAGYYDTGLLRVDPGGALATDPTTGVVTVPLEVNPRFGKQIIPGSELARLRVTVKVWF